LGMNKASCALRNAQDKKSVGLSNLDLPFYFSFFFQNLEPKAHVWHQSKPANIYFLVCSSIRSISSKFWMKEKSSI
jgi:hypothetical protein